MDVISKEVAIKEIDSWLDFKKINVKKRELYKDNIETLVDAIVDGTLSLRDDKTFVHTLKFPFGEDSKTTSFEYKPRVKVFEVQNGLQGVKGTDAQGLLSAYISILTGKAPGIVKNMDTEDNSVAQAIAIFFL